MNVLYPKVSGSGKRSVSIPLANYNSDILQIVQSYNLLPDISILEVHTLLGSNTPDAAGDGTIWVLASHNSCLRSILVTAGATSTADASGNQRVEFAISFEYSDFRFDSGLWERIRNVHSLTQSGGN